MEAGAAPAAVSAPAPPAKVAAGGTTPVASSGVPAAAATGAAEKTDKPKIVVSKVGAEKEIPLHFVDEIDAYKPRILPPHREEYWTWAVLHKWYPKMPPNFSSWFSAARADDYDTNIATFPKRYVRFLNRSMSKKWDRAYLYLLIVWLIIVGVYSDGFLDSIIEIPIALLNIPLVLMSITQFIPIVGAIMGTVYYNDLIKFMAVKKIGDWALVGVLVAQYIEFAYYGGHNRIEAAGRCRLVDLDGNPIVYPPQPPSLLQNAWAWVRARLPQRVSPAESTEGTEDDDSFEYEYDDEDDIDYFLNAAGNLAYLDDDGNEVEVPPEKVEELARREKQREADGFLDDLSSLGGEGDDGGDSIASFPAVDIEMGKLPGGTTGRKASEANLSARKASMVQNRRASMRRRSSVGGFAPKRGNAKLGRRASIVSAALKLASDKLDKQLQEEENVLGQGGGYLSRKRQEEEQKKEQQRLERIERKKLEEEGCTDWLEWKCIICKRDNRRPRNMKASFNTGFIVKGVYFKRTVVALQPSPMVPLCEGCGTPSNYVPRLCNRQLIPDIEDPYLAFKNYPLPVPPIQRNEWLKRWDKLISFFVGQWNHPNSKQMPNDWRLSLYLSSRFPVQLRHEKKPDEHYEIGEIVECKLQMKDWSRARIIGVKKPHAYDIMYNTGNVVRVVPEKDLRLPPAKGWYAYRIELFLVGVISFTPLSLALGLLVGEPGLLFLPLFFGSLFLVLLRTYNFYQNMVEFYSAGCIMITRQNALFILPSLFCLIGSGIGLSASATQSWTTTVIMLVLGIGCSLPFLYMKRVTFAVMLLPALFLFGIGGFDAAARLDGYALDFDASFTVVPNILLCFLLLKYRKLLGSIYDVSLIIRPINNAEFHPSYPILLARYLKKRCLDQDSDDEGESKGDEEESKDSGGGDDDVHDGALRQGRTERRGAVGAIPALVVAPP